MQYSSPWERDEKRLVLTFLSTHDMSSLSMVAEIFALLRFIGMNVYSECLVFMVFVV